MGVGPKARIVDQPRLHVHLVPWMVAGVQTQYLHLEKELARAGINLSLNQIRPFIPGGLIERLPLPSKTRGTIRSLMVLNRAFQNPSDALWTQVALPVLPFLLTAGWLRRAPVFYATDCTPKLLFGMDQYYKIADDPGSLKGRLTTKLLRAYFQRCAAVLPWSQWAARSIIDDYGADGSKIQIVPPGIDTARWKPADRRTEPHQRLQLLFVGADFERKGGPLMLDVFRRHLRDTCDLHMVTRAKLSPEPGVTVHSNFKPDDPELLKLYQSSDVLVLPTLADCFSLASIEAMACGLPVIASPVGGIPEIVADGESGLLVPPGHGRSLLEAIESLRVGGAQMRGRMGRTGREIVLRRFNATTQSRLVVNLMLGVIAERQLTSPAHHPGHGPKKGGPESRPVYSNDAPRPTATVVVPTRNRGELIRETLHTLAQIQNPAVEILVADQSTNDNTRKAVEAVSASDPRVRLIPTATVGSSAARNVGARHASGEVIAYCDDDCIVAPGWLDAILEEFRDPSVDAVYGRLLPYEDVGRNGREVGFKPSQERTEYSSPVPPWYVGHGGNMAFRRRTLLELGGFDPLLSAGGVFGACEDPDIALRLLRQRRKVVYSPEALSYHKHWKDWRAQKAMERNYGIGAGAEFAKYIRCGDLYGAQLLAIWIWQMGVRRVGAGIFKWRSLKNMYLGYCQMVYPWVGIARSLRHPIDRKLLLYVAAEVKVSKEAPAVEKATIAKEVAVADQVPITEEAALPR